MILFCSIATLLAIFGLGLLYAILPRTTLLSFGTERDLLELAVFRHRFLPVRLLELWYDARVLGHAYGEARETINFARRRPLSRFRGLISAATALPRTLKMVRRDALGRLVTSSGRYGRVRPISGGHGPQYEPAPLLYSVSGHSNLPRRVYEGDSIHVYLDLRVSLAAAASEPETSVVPTIATDSNPFSLTLRSSGMHESIVIELKSTGFATQQVSAKASPLISGEHRFSWICEFPKSGKHAYVYKVSVGADYDGILATSGFEVPMSVLVVKVDHLTSRQVWVLASTSATIAAVMALIRFIYEFGLLKL